MLLLHTGERYLWDQACWPSCTWINIECIAFNTYHSCIFFSRHVDDILFITSSREEATSIHQTFSSIVTNITFEIEYPHRSGTLSLLGVQLRLTEEGSIFTNFYRKAASSKFFVYYQLNLVTRTKATYVIYEIAHINRNCSEVTD